MVPMNWYTYIVKGSTNGTNGNANGTTGSPNGTIGKPMVQLATNGKITNRSIGKPRTEPL